MRCRLVLLAVLLVLLATGAWGAPLGYRFGDGPLLQQARGGQRADDAGRDAVHRRWCVRHAQMGHWQMEVQRAECAGAGFATCTALLRPFNRSTDERPPPAAWRWDAPAQRECHLRRVEPIAARRFLGGAWIVFAGDSIVRLLFAALLRLLSTDGSQQVQYGHRDFEYELACDIRASFLWTPYPANLSAALAGWQPPNSSPDLVVMGNGLWPMLHSGDAAAFERELRDAARAATALASETPLLWMTIPSLVGRKLKTEEKRRMMTTEQVAAYNTAATRSGMVSPTGPARVLDMHALTRGCGEACTHDGIHYNDAAYDAVLQQLLQVLPRTDTPAFLLRKRPEGQRCSAAVHPGRAAYQRLVAQTRRRFTAQDTKGPLRERPSNFSRYRMWEGGGARVS